MFLPFGPLYLLSWPQATGKKTMLVGFGIVLLIEVLQPIFGRMFDSNDVILNALAWWFLPLLFWGSKRGRTPVKRRRPMAGCALS